ncbi:E3 ubiquitin/ISG15 ligase TRIM25-like [Astyanax mexicanus]|uniref:E3 ubiquitin/ISG15 ligase TRIM25-like n=1 Tax=Astyanax mexicanus TaxID=7994 RepID=UPI0020CB660E|nr:E3 ubiquitin/ISG15 ligase TRIM25-like [Astyanax mexicanus]
MAEASILDQDQFSCSVCLDLMKNPVTIPCGHSYCMVCINGCWDQEDERGVYSCPQCRETFTPRPVLRRNNMLAEVVEKLKKTEVRAASPAHCYAGAGDVECDFCTGRKLKAIKSCLVCLASYCETHLQPHYQSPAFKKHKLVKASKQLQEKICSQHDKLIEIYCRTDQQFICYLCTMEEHKGHDTILAAAERTGKQRELKDVQKKSQQRLQEKEKKLQELKQAVKSVKLSAQSAVEDSARIFTELIRSIEKKRSEVTELIRDQEKTELSAAEELLEQLEQEITDLKRRNTELEQLSHTEDHIHFLQSFQSVCVSSRCENLPSITVHHHLSFDEVRKSLSDLKKRLEEICNEEMSKIPVHGKRSFLLGNRKTEILTSSLIGYKKSLHRSLSSEPKRRQDFLQYFCQLTLDPNTVNHDLIVSEKNKVVSWSKRFQHYSDHPERFDSRPQVLSKESLSGRCYWEVEWSSEGWGVSISVSYKGISRKGLGEECVFGFNSESWRLRCSSSPSFCHNSVETQISAPPSSRIGVYVDHSAGTLSFYSVSDTMTLLHTVHTTFTQPLYAGFGLGSGASVKLCKM